MALTQLTIGDAKFRAGRWQGRADLATLVPLSAAQTLDRESLSAARNILRNQGFQAVVTAPVAPPERAAFLLDDFSEREHLHLLRYEIQPRSATNQPPSKNQPRSATNQPPSKNQPRSTTNQPPSENQPRSTTNQPPSENQPRSTTNQPPSENQPRSTTNQPPSENQPRSTTNQPGGATAGQTSGQRLRPWQRPRPRIRRGTRRDWDDVLTLDRQSFDEFWHFDRDGLQDSIEATPLSRLRIMRHSDLAEPPKPDNHSTEIAGYALAGHSGGTGYLQRLAVHPAVRQQGIGTLLANDALAWIRRRGAKIAWVNTQKTNNNALQLYQKLGFTLQENPLTVMYRTLT